MAAEHGSLAYAAVVADAGGVDVDADVGYGLLPEENGPNGVYADAVGGSADEVDIDT